ncbi:MAG: hypothetical protein JW795_11650 [Chitinivibrionales bacterium]|nr:hypothetical protein [Chitinivibrionales bacterium]
MIHRKEKLGIAYIYGHLYAQVHAPGEATRSWEYPKVLKSEELLGEFIDVIPQAIDFKGEEVSLVIATAAVQYTLVKTFPMRQKDLQQFIKTKASSVWEKEEPFAYGWGMLQWSGTQNAKKELYIHLHLMPESYVIIFLNFCKKYSLQPTHIFTAASLTPDLLDLIDQSDNGLNLVVASAGDRTFITLGRKHEPYLIRELPYSWLTKEPDAISRVGREIQRTVLFTKQQFNVSVSAIKLIGTGAATALTSVDEQARVPTTADDSDVPWIRLTMHSLLRRSENLIPDEVLGHNQRKRMTIALFSVLFLFLLSVMGIEFAIQHRLQYIDRILREDGLEESIQTLISRRNELEKIIEEVNTNASIATIIKSTTLEPVPGWFAGFAADMLPAELLISRLAVRKNSDQGVWNVEIDGFSPRNPVKAATLLEEYQKRLSSDSSIVAVETPYQIQWIENLKTGGTYESEKNGKRFRITGRIR